MGVQPSVSTANSPLSAVRFTTGKSVQFSMYSLALCELLRTQRFDSWLWKPNAKFAEFAKLKGTEPVPELLQPVVRKTDPTSPLAIEHPIDPGAVDIRARPGA